LNLRIEHIYECIERYEIIKELPINGICNTWSRDEKLIVYSLIWNQKQFTLHSGGGPKGYFVVWHEGEHESGMHYEKCKFDEYFAPKSEYRGWHEGKKFGI